MATLLIINGYAGTGKSSVSKAFAKKMVMHFYHKTHFFFSSILFGIPRKGLLLKNTA